MVNANINVEHVQRVKTLLVNNDENTAIVFTTTKAYSKINTYF